jgi:hypothetical protein
MVADDRPIAMPTKLQYHVPNGDLGQQNPIDGLIELPEASDHVHRLSLTLRAHLLDNIAAGHLLFLMLSELPVMLFVTLL